MFKKKKKKGLKEILFPFKKGEKKKTEIPVRIKEKDNYVVLEPVDVSERKKSSLKPKLKTRKEALPMKKETIKEEIRPKTEEIKPKLIIQKIESKEIKPERPVQKVLPNPAEKFTGPEELTSKIPLNHIETDIDELMRIIDEKKVVGLDYLSKTLKISVDRLETWAKMLEERGLIEIEYPIIGLPKLRKKECKKES